MTAHIYAGAELQAMTEGGDISGQVSMLTNGCSFTLSTPSIKTLGRITPSLLTLGLRR